MKEKRGMGREEEGNGTKVEEVERGVGKGWKRRGERREKRAFTSIYHYLEGVVLL